jgi:hypothetical protein
MRRFLLPIVLLVASWMRADAQEQVALSWGGCSPLDNREFAGPETYALDALLTGSGRTVQGFVLRIDVLSELAQCQRGDFPDAWKFEQGGCNEGRWSVEARNLASGSCSGLITDQPLMLQLFEVHPDYAAARRIRLEVGFTHPVTLDPLKTYRLASMTFDHARSMSGLTASPDSCGRADEPLCFYLFQADWIDVQGQSGSWLHTTSSVTWNGNESHYSCPVLCDPALPSTWGGIKVRYR